MQIGVSSEVYTYYSKGSFTLSEDVLPSSNNKYKNTKMSKTYVTKKGIVAFETFGRVYFAFSWTFSTTGKSLG